MAALYDNVFDSVSGSSPHFFLFLPATVKTSPATTAPSQSSMQCFNDLFAHRDDKFTDLDLIYVQRGELVTSRKTCLEKAKARTEELRKESDLLFILHAN